MFCDSDHKKQPLQFHFSKGHARRYPSEDKAESHRLFQYHCRRKRMAGKKERLWMRGFLFRPYRDRPCIEVPPAIDIHEVLIPREERSLADPLLGRGAFHFVFKAVDQIAHYPAGDPGPVGRIDETEEDKMAEKQLPMLVETLEQAGPLDAFHAGPFQNLTQIEHVLDIGE